MTREVLAVLVGFVTLCGLAATVMKIHLLVKTLRRRKYVLGLPVDKPERIVADDRVLEYSGRVVLTLAVMGVGALFVYAVLNAPAPPNPDGTYPINQASLVLLGLLLVLGLEELFQGVRAEVNGARLDSSIDRLSEPPDACLATNFEGCPYVSPTRLLEIRATARKLVEEVEEITDTPATTSPTEEA